MVGAEEFQQQRHHRLGRADYPLTERLRLGVNYSFLWRDENYYNQFEDQFIPAKTKHSVGRRAAIS